MKYNKTSHQEEKTTNKNNHGNNKKKLVLGKARDFPSEDTIKEQQNIKRRKQEHI